MQCRPPGKASKRAEAYTCPLKGFGTLQAHPPSYDTGPMLATARHFPLICAGRVSPRVSEPGRCLWEDREKGGGETNSLHLAVVKNAV